MLILKSTAKLSLGVNGKEDIDVLIQGDVKLNRLPSRNVFPLKHKDRFDIFKIHNGKLLHFDAHEKYCLGPKFCKTIKYKELDLILRERRYLKVKFFRFITINMITTEEELKLFVARSIMRSYVSPLIGRFYLSDTIFEEFGEYLGKKPIKLKYTAYKTSINLRPHSDRFYISRSDVVNLRRRILADAEITEFQFVLLTLRHLAKYLYYAFARKTKLFWVSKRGIESGLVVAFVAPDGLGKSSLVDAVHSDFVRKFDCYKAYLGIGDGAGFKIRKQIQSRHAADFKRIEDSEIRPFRKKILAVIRGIFGVLVALEKLVKIRKIFRAKNETL